MPTLRIIRFLPKFEFSAVRNGYRDLWPILYVNWHLGYPFDHVVVASDDFAKNNMFAWHTLRELWCSKPHYRTHHSDEDNPLM
jgi:hypothetical protein